MFSFEKFLPFPSPINGEGPGHCGHHPRTAGGPLEAQAHGTATAPQKRGNRRRADGLVVPSNQKSLPPHYRNVILKPVGLTLAMARVRNLPLLQMSWEASNLMVSLRRTPGQVRDARPWPFSELRSASFLLSRLVNHRCLSHLPLLSDIVVSSGRCSLIREAIRTSPLLHAFSSQPCQIDVPSESLVSLGRDGPSRHKHHEMGWSW